MPTTVVVTGASGFVAGELIKQLLAKGYTVNATTRSLSDKPKYSHLLSLPGADRLHLFEVNLQDAQSYKDSFAGAKFVFHVATPAILSSNNNWNDIVNPTVQNATNVFEAAVAAKSVEAFIYTSTIVTAFLYTAPRLGHTYTEADWSTEAKLETDPYPLGKRLAEEALNTLASKHKNIRLVSLLPGCVIGPYFDYNSTPHTLSTLTLSLRDFFLPIVNAPGEGNIPPLTFPFVDVRDVALAHILAAENPNCATRYQLFNESHSYEEVAGQLKKLYPTLPIASKVVAPAPNYTFDNSKIKKDLGIAFRPLQDSLQTTVDQFLRDGLVKPIAN